MDNMPETKKQIVKKEMLIKECSLLGAVTKILFGRETKNCKILATLIEFFFGVEVSFALRLRTTWIVLYRNSRGEEYSVYWQLSLKDPWLVPRYNPEFGKDKQPLYGWLFFYFGKHKEN